MIFTSIPRLRYSHGTYSFEVAAHGLEKALALSRQELADELNANVFYKRLVSASESSFWNIAQRCAESKESTSAE